MRGMLLIPLMSVTYPSHIPLTSIFKLKEGERTIDEGVMRGICDG